VQQEVKKSMQGSELNIYKDLNCTELFINQHHHHIQNTFQRKWFLYKKCFWHKNKNLLERCISINNNSNRKSTFSNFFIKQEKLLPATHHQFVVTLILICIYYNLCLCYVYKFSYCKNHYYMTSDNVCFWLADVPINDLYKTL